MVSDRTARTVKYIKALTNSSDYGIKNQFHIADQTVEAEITAMMPKERAWLLESG